MEEKIISNFIERLNTYRIFKFSSNLAQKSELKAIFKKKTKKEILKIILFLNEEGLIKTFEEFYGNKINDESYVSFIILWDDILNSKYNKGNLKTITSFKEKYPFAYQSIKDKTLFLAKLEGEHWKQPATNINALDNLFLSYFLNKERFNKHKNLTIQDVYVNLRTIVKFLPVQEAGLFGLSRYEKILEEFDVKLEDKFKKKLKKLVNQRLEEIVKKEKAEERRREIEKKKQQEEEKRKEMEESAEKNQKKDK